MLWKKQNNFILNSDPIVEDDIKELEKAYNESPEILTISETVSVNGKKGMWALEEVIILLRENGIRFKIVL